jgi:PAS domain S-box-containing protein
MSQQAGQNSSARDEGDALQRGPLDRAPGDGALHEARLEASADQEHERVRDLLRESEAGLRGLIEAYAQATWETDANGVVVVDSPSWRAQTGQALEDWLNRGWIDAVHPEDRGGAERQWRAAVEDRRNFDVELRVRNANGGYRWTNIRAAPVAGRGGEVAKWVGMNVDIHHRRLIHDALRDNEQWLALIFELLPVGVGVMDDQGALILSNRAMQHFIPSGVIPSRDPRRVGRWRAQHPDHGSVGPDDFPGARALRGESVLPGLEMLYAQDDGREAWTRVAAVPIRSGNGAIKGAITVATDIDALKRSDLALVEGEARFRQFAAASSDVLWIRNADTMRWEYLSQAFERIYGLSREAAHDGDLHHWADLIVAADRAHALDRISRACAGEQVSFEYRITRDGEIRWLRSSVFPMRDSCGRVQRIGGIGRDITELRSALHHRERLLAELQHRVRNTLAVIRSIARRTADSSETVEDFASHLDGRIGAFARVQIALTRDPLGGFDLAKLVAEELRACVAREGEQFSVRGLEVRLKPKAAESIGLAVHELATNAVKHGAFTVAGGHVEVQWCRESRDGEPWLSLDWNESGMTGRPVALLREGFGTMLLQQTLAYDLGATVERTFAPDGFRCRISFPLAANAS